jgi:cobalt-zinc-cadmium efflux system outer membrane protein
LLLGSLTSQVSEAEALPSFNELLRQAERTAPRLIEGAANVDAIRGLAQQAAALPNPQVSFQSENFAGSGAFNRISPVQNTLSLSQALEIGGKRGSRVAAGRAELDAARVSYAQAKVDFAYDLAIAYATAETAQARADLVAEELARAQEDLRMARALVDSGRESDLRALQAQAAAGSARADLEAARADAARALLGISSLMGVSQPYTAIGPSLLKLAASFQGTPSEPAQASPAVLVAQAQRDAAALKVDMERKRAISDLTVSVGARRLPGEDVNAMVAGVSVALPIFDRNRGAVAARLAELSSADARLNAARLQATTDWQSAVLQSKAVANRLTASDETESAAREAYRLSRIGYDAGKNPLIELLTTRHTLIDAQLRLLDAHFARLQAEASLARLSGRVPFGEAP